MVWPMKVSFSLWQNSLLPRSVLTTKTKNLLIVAVLCTSKAVSLFVMMAPVA